MFIPLLWILNGYSNIFIHSCSWRWDHLKNGPTELERRDWLVQNTLKPTEGWCKYPPLWLYRQFCVLIFCASLLADIKIKLLKTVTLREVFAQNKWKSNWCYNRASVFQRLCAAFFTNNIVWQSTMVAHFLRVNIIDLFLLCRYLILSITLNLTITCFFLL